MKRLYCLLLLLLVLSGCGTNPLPETEPPAETVPQTTARATLREQMVSWEVIPELKRLPLDHMNLTADARVLPMGKHLLVWELKYDLDLVSGLQLRVVELEYGEVIAQREIPVEEWIEPRIQQDRILLCNGSKGEVLVLNEKLETVSHWETEPDYNQWFMGRDSRLYILNGMEIRERDLDTGAERVVLDRLSGCYAGDITGQGATLWYMDVDTAREMTGYLNFETGEVEQQPFRGRYSGAEQYGDLWLNQRYMDSVEFRFGNGAQAWDIRISEGQLFLTEGGHLLEESDGIYLYDTDGVFLGGFCHITDTHYLSAYDSVWCPALNGYLFMAYDMDFTTGTLLLWNPEKGAGHENLVLEPVDLTLTEADELAQLRDRANAIGEAYSLKIWIGSECQTDFDDFTAAEQSDPDMVSYSLDVLERALGSYPEGFFLQLRYDIYQQIHIHLISDLIAKPHYGNGGSYQAFVQPQNGYYLMVMDVNGTSEGTYFHEISHIIDDYLAWDSWNREDALYSEEGWEALNPEGFEYTWDYAMEQTLAEEMDSYFIDTYSTINSTEDRARVLEYGMWAGSEWFFEEKPHALEKLKWYAMCIRDGFDTTGWPEELLWEQYLK